MAKRSKAAMIAAKKAARVFLSPAASKWKYRFHVWGKLREVYLREGGLVAALERKDEIKRWLDDREVDWFDDGEFFLMDDDDVAFEFKMRWL